jgi:hypothetical protein
LRKQVDGEDALGLGRVARDSCRDRSPQHQRIGARPDGTLNRRAVGDVALQNAQPLLMARKFLACHSRQVRAVKERHGIATLEQMLRDVEPDEAGATDDRDPHRKTRLKQFCAKIPLRIHVGDEAPGRFCRFAAAAGEEAARTGQRR